MYYRKATHVNIVDDRYTHLQRNKSEYVHVDLPYRKEMATYNVRS
jgi:hypothetical protein